MMEAAQLAAEAAIQEAAREAANSASRGDRSSGRPQQQQDQQHHSRHHHATMDMDASDPTIGMDPEQIAFLQAMQAAEMGDNADMMHDLGVMGFGNSPSESVQSLLHMLAQQEQESHRPEEHYLTIAQNGKSLCLPGCAPHRRSFFRFLL